MALEVNDLVKNETNKLLKLAVLAKYSILKDIDPDFEEKPKLEEALETVSNKDYRISGYIYSFKENFLRTVGKNPFNANIKDYREDALNYMRETFPYGFNINFANSDIMMMLPEKEQLDANLYFYARSQGASDEKAMKIDEVLSQTMRRNPLQKNTIAIDSSKPIERKDVDIMSVAGSVVDKYSGNNLYEILRSINDKKVGSFIEYIMKNGGLEGSQKIFNGLGMSQDSEGNIYIAEGNHRVLTYQALSQMKRSITGTNPKGITIPADVNKILLHPKDQVREDGSTPTFE